MKRLFCFAAAICFLLSASAQWAQVNTSIANVRTNKGQGQELCTQEYMGMPVKVLAQDGGWTQVETTDGYHGWIASSALVKMNDQELREWKLSPRLVVTSMHEIKAYDSPFATEPRSVVTDLVPCDIVQGVPTDPINGRVQITLPDGRQAWAQASALTPIQQWATQPFNSHRLLEQAYSCLGIPYLWGGNSPKGLDCSGLAKLSYLTNGIFLLRDASMQAKTGQPIDFSDWHNFKQGDLLFFGNANTRKVTHVAIYDNDGFFIHSSGRGERVDVNSIVPGSDLNPGYTQLGARRIHGSEGTPGIIKAIDHPWLFEKEK